VRLGSIIQLAISLVFLFISTASAKVIYVSQSAIGDGSGTSRENACTSITPGPAASASHICTPNRRLR